MFWGSENHEMACISIIMQPADSLPERELVSLSKYTYVHVFLPACLPAYMSARCMHTLPIYRTIATATSPGYRSQGLGPRLGRPRGRPCMICMSGLLVILIW